jgi:hypothetical protein
MFGSGESSNDEKWNERDPRAQAQNLGLLVPERQGEK